MPPLLNAAGLIPHTSPLSAFFAEDESTATLGIGLPACVIVQQAGSFLELYNVDTGFVAGRHGPFDNTPSGSGFLTFVEWNTTAYPVLKTSYTGLYICRTDTANSTATYQLNVRSMYTFNIQYWYFTYLLCWYTVERPQGTPLILYCHDGPWPIRHNE